MLKKILIVIGAASIFLISGAATAVTLSAVMPIKKDTTPQVSYDDELTSTPTETPSDTTKTNENPQDTQDSATTTQSDTQVKNTTSAIVTALNSYSANNRGALPTSSATLSIFNARYLSEIDLSNPTTGGVYTLQFGADVDTKDAFSFQPGTACSADGTQVTASSASRSFSVSITLPSGKLFCMS